jgi:RES domain-containing protein
MAESRRKLKEHAASERLESALRRCQPDAFAWHGVVYRSATVRYASREDLITGAGSRQAAARWNVPGITAVYTSLEPETATAEGLSHYRYYGVPLEKALPRILAAIRIKARRILNLSDAAIRRRLGVKLPELLGEDWRASNDHGNESFSQAIARLSWRSGWWHGVLVESAAHPGGSNLVLFPWNFEPPKDYMLLLSPDELPPPR